MQATRTTQEPHHDAADAATKPLPVMRPAPSRPGPVDTALAGLVPFALIVYLAMQKGGFGVDAYSEIGLLAWWVVAVGLIGAALSLRRIGTAGWIGLGLLGAFTLWTALGIGWSQSAERSYVEAARVAVYLGVFAGALLLGGPQRLRITLAAVGAACGVIAAIALLSRLQPGWFPENEIADVLPSVQSRLAYPLNYWNALAGLIAIGLPLIAAIAVGARQALIRGLAAAAIPVMALAIYYTYSRGGLIATAAGIVALLALSPRRLGVLAALLPAAVGSGVLIWAASAREGLAAGLTDPGALAEGDQMLLLTIAVVLVVGVVSAGLGVARERGRLPDVPRVPRRVALGIVAAFVLVAAVGFVALDGPDRVSDGWTEFKQPTDPGDESSRLSSAAGNGRWQYWSAAVDANATDPLRGIGPGTFVFWWSEHRDISGFIRDAHSLFVETLGELGIIGLALIAGFVGFVVAAGCMRCLRATGTHRLELAAATGSAIAFAFAAGLDWLWELAVIPVAFLLVAAAILSTREPGTAAPAAPRSARSRRLGGRRHDRRGRSRRWR